MEPDPAAEMKPDTGKSVFAFAAPAFFFFNSASPFLSPLAVAPKVTFAALDIFLRRSKLRCEATCGLPGFFSRIPVS